MNEFSCCHGRPTSGRPIDPEAPRQRPAKVASFLLSSITLILMPKCPVCVATYVAFFTGLGLTTEAAGQVRMALMVICISVLAFLALTALRWICRWVKGADLRGSDSAWKKVEPCLAKAQN